MKTYNSGDSSNLILEKILENQQEEFDRAGQILAAIQASSGGGGSTPSSSIVTGTNVTVAAAGTRVQGGANAASRGVFVGAPTTNSGSIFVGDVTVTNGSGTKRGTELLPGGFAFFSVSNSNLLYFDADTSGDKACLNII